MITKGAVPTATLSITWSGTPPARSDYLVEVMLCPSGLTCNFASTGTLYAYVPGTSTSHYARAPMPAITPIADSGVTINHLTVQ